jgi:hypothetical protein
MDGGVRSATNADPARGNDRIDPEPSGSKHELYRSGH